MKYIISLAATLLLLGCTSEQNSSASTTEEALVPTVVEKSISSTTKELAIKADEVVAETKSAAQDAVTKVKEITTEETAAKIKELAIEAKATAEETAAKARDIAAEIAAETKKQKETIASAVILFDAEITFQRKCGGCHGSNGEKVALGKSQIIKGWDVEKTVAALQGYKDGTYGAAMKGLMVSQVSSFDSNEIRLLAEFISKQ